MLADGNLSEADQAIVDGMFMAMAAFERSRDENNMPLNSLPDTLIMPRRQAGFW